MKKKKFITVLLSLLLTLNLVACGSNKTTETPTETPTESTGEEFSADKNLTNVEVTLPASFFEDTTQEEIETEAKASGVKEVKFNEDGSVVYKMSKSDYKKLLEDTKVSIDEGIAEIVNDKENYSSIEKIEYNKELSEFTIYCSPEIKNGFEGMSAMVLYFFGNYYQVLNGSDNSTVKTIVYFKDKDSGEIIETYDSSSLSE